MKYMYRLVYRRRRQDTELRDKAPKFSGQSSEIFFGLFTSGMNRCGNLESSGGIITPGLGSSFPPVFCPPPSSCAFGETWRSVRPCSSSPLGRGRFVGHIFSFFARILRECVLVSEVQPLPPWTNIPSGLTKSTPFGSGCANSLLPSVVARASLGVSGISILSSGWEGAMSLVCVPVTQSWRE